MSTFNITPEEEWYEEEDFIDTSLCSKHSKIGYLDTEKNYQKSFNLGFKQGSLKGYSEGFKLGTAAVAEKFIPKDSVS